MRAELGGEILETGPAPGGVLNLNTLGDAVMAASRVLTKYDNTTNCPLSGNFILRRKRSQLKNAGQSNSSVTDGLDGSPSRPPGSCQSGRLGEATLP